MRTRIPCRLLGVGLLAAAALGGCTTGSTGTGPAGSSAPAAASSGPGSLTIGGSVSLTLPVTGVLCGHKQDGTAGWEVYGSAVSASSGQTEPWSVQQYPATSPATFRIYLPDGSQYSTDAAAQDAPTGYTYSASRLVFTSTPLYANGDSQAAKVTVTGSFACPDGSS